MAFRPQAFSIPSSTELKITFNQNISNNISTENFTVESLSGSTDDLRVSSINIDKNVVTVKTSPQVAGNYYLLHLVDASNEFASEKGERLISDNTSRDLFFIGIDKVNPIRDRIFEKIPGLFNLQNSILKNVLSAHSEEIYAAQAKLGELLSDNYISVDVVDEFRTRSSGAVDRLANEQAYEITRVSKFPTSSRELDKEISYNKDNLYKDLQKIPRSPISLQERLIESEEISVSTEFNSFKDLKISVSKKNILKVLSILVVKEDDEENCNGDIGTFYDIKRFKYTIKDNKYDIEYALSLSSLNDNEILLSEFGNISSLNSNDKVYVTYLYKNVQESINLDTLDVYDVRLISAESVPSNITRFFLKNAPIVNKDGIVPAKNGVKFYINENINLTPAEFKKELVFDSSRLPKEPGEYSINYKTGEVFLVGLDDRQGTGRNNYIAKYFYKKTYEENLDYFISNNDIIFNKDRVLLNKFATLEFKYENVFVNDIDYKFKSHIEVLGESVNNKISQAFSVTTNNSPITNVYRIYNETTGEVYNFLYKTDDEIFFSGNRSPEIKIQENESAEFFEIYNEKLNISEVGYSNPFTVRITSAASTNSILFDPSIPAELISQNSDDYFMSNNSRDINIRFFGFEDSNNLIGSIGIGIGVTLPTVNEFFDIGLKVYKISLDNINILNKEKNAVGSALNSSIEFSRPDLFINEKYFISDLTNLRIVGDYSVDYTNGIIYLTVSKNQDSDLGFINYSFNRIDTNFKNVLSSIKTVKKSNSEIIEYDVTNTSNDIFIKNLESSIVRFDNETIAPDLDGNLKNICEVLEDYTVVVPYPILNISSINKSEDVFSANLNATSFSDRVAEKTISELKTKVSEGGFNLFEENKIVKNVIDLKKNINRKFYLNNSGVFQLVIKDDNIGQLYSVSINNTVIFNNSLNIAKEKNIKIFGATPSGPNYIVDIESKNINNINIDNYLLDKNNNRFKILNINTLTSQITVESPAENNSLFLSPEIDILGNNSSIIVRAETIYTDDSLTINIPGDAPISSSILYNIKYTKTFTPDIGTPLVIDYNFGSIFTTYNYVNDSIKIWYEYGDNEIDWSISNSLLEGEDYYVSYKYGANREALRNNFGSLTQIPTLQEFPLNFDREIYRDAVEAVLQSFPRGPSIETFERIGETFTDIKPQITETRFSEWNIGRDYLNPKKINYKGNLNFVNGRFDSGLEFNKDTIVNIPTDSSISISEGTLECWISPNWSGISNDASITFNINNIGKESSLLTRNPFNNGWQALTKNSNGTFDFTSENRISNYDLNNNMLYVDEIGIYKNISLLSVLTKCDMSFIYSVSEFGQKLNDIYLNNVILNEENLKISEVYISDSNKKVGLSFDLNIAQDFAQNDIEYLISDINVEQDNIAPFNGPHRTRLCSCKTLQISNKNINEYVIVFDLLDSINIGEIFENKELITNSPEVFVISMSNGDLYQVIGFEYLNNQYFNVIPQNADKIIVKRLPINNNLLSKNIDEINSPLTGSFKLFYKNINIIGSHSFSDFGNQSNIIVNWSSPLRFKIERDSSKNIVSISVENKKFSYFYTKFESNNSSGIYFVSLDTNSISSIKFANIKIDFYNRFNLSDIYIGSSGYNPKNKIFTLNRKNANDNGLSDLINTNEGIFIGFDENCVSPLTDVSGQWIFRTRVLESVSIPIDIISYSPGEFENINDIIYVEHKFSGTILTDGEFGSVLRSRKTDIGNCDYSDLEFSFRFCGSGPLDDGGWRALSPTGSELINILGGRESQKLSWRKNGIATSALSNGIFRISGENTSFISEIPNISGIMEATSSFKVVSYETSEESLGLITADLTGISPLEINRGVNFKASLAVFEGDFIVIIFSNDSIIDVINYDWDNANFNEFKVLFDDNNKYLYYINNVLLSSGNVLESDESNNYIAIYTSEYDNNNIVDFDLISLHMREQKELLLESDDIFISTDSKIEFEFTSEVDGYLSDGYVDGYSYVTDEFDENEIIFSSDAIHYIVDSGQSPDKQRLSLFKDGKGFLNFRILAKNEKFEEQHSIYNIATAIKNFTPGEWHHIAASWKIGSVEKQDEMHLFVDGFEAPNLYKFGGKLPVYLNTAYSDISREVLQTFYQKNITYPERYVDGSVSAGTSIFTSGSIFFTEEDIGKSLVVYNAPIATDLIGKELVIIGVTLGNAILGTGKDLNLIKFIASDSNIEFAFAPYSDNILTDVKNNKFAIFRTTNLDENEEFGGTLYKVVNGTIEVLPTDVVNPKFRANVDTKYIEFIGENADCLYFDTVLKSDLNIDIQTFGLNTELCSKKFNLSSPSYMVDDQKFSGQSVIYLFGKDPIDLSDVKIKRIILERTALDVNINSNNLSEFNITLDPFVSKVSSDFVEVIKNNSGRYLSVVIESDNINFCNDDYDGYGVSANVVTIFGETVDGSNFEEFSITKNGATKGSKLFKRVDRVEGQFVVIDENYFELGVLSVEETDTLNIGNNGGEELEVFDHIGGYFVLTANGSNGTYPFELHPGAYHIEYSTYLSIDLEQLGDRLYIGSDLNEKNSFDGIIDEFRIVSEKYSDTRVTEDSHDNSSVTKDYLNPNEFCPDETTLTLIHFNDPRNLQIRRLKNITYLDDVNNIKYKVDRDQLEELFKYLNNESLFVKTMLSYGFSLDEAEKTFIETNKADEGPLWDDAFFIENYDAYGISKSSVNNLFNNAAIFKNSSGLIIDNTSFVRNNEGTIEFWVSPLSDTRTDDKDRFYFDAFNGTRVFKKVTNTKFIDLDLPARNILSIKLTNAKKQNASFTTDNDTIFDEITRSSISGRLEGGTGVDKDFSIGHKLANNGRRIILKESLPSGATGVVISYIPLDSNGDRIFILKNKEGQLVFGITANNIDNVIKTQIDWKKNTWHKIKCVYKTGTAGQDFINVFVDGVDVGIIKYGTGLIYGTGLVYGQFISNLGKPNVIDYRIPLKDSLSRISIGSDVFGTNSANSRMDNFRISYKVRSGARNSDGVFIDENYSENINTVSPLIKDDLTTLLLDFDSSKEIIDNFTNVIDEKRGLYNFIINIDDSFSKINYDEQIESLIDQLVQTIKPAHTNAYLKFNRNKC